MTLEKPAAIANDSFKSQKWDEIVAGRNFEASQIPVLTMLVHWYSVAQRCIDDMDDADGQVAYQNDMGDIKPLPQISTLKMASAEIRQINKMLGLGETGASKGKGKSISTLMLIKNDREKKRVAAGR